MTAPSRRAPAPRIIWADAVNHTLCASADAARQSSQCSDDPDQCARCGLDAAPDVQLSQARRMRRKQGFKIALHIKKVNQTRCGTPLFFPYRSVSEGARHQRLREIRNVECIRGDRRVGVKYAPR